MYGAGKPRDSPSQEREINGIRANEGHEDESIDERTERPLDPRLKTGDTLAVSIRQLSGKRFNPRVKGSA